MNVDIIPQVLKKERKEREDKAMTGQHMILVVPVPLAPGAIGAISADEVAHHQVPLAPGAIGAISADEVAHHQVPLAPGAIGAISADEVAHHQVPLAPSAMMRHQREKAGKPGRKIRSLKKTLSKYKQT